MTTGSFAPNEIGGVKKILHKTLGVWCALSAKKITGPVFGKRITTLKVSVANSDIIIQRIKQTTENTVQSTSFQELKDDLQNRFVNSRVNRQVFFACRGVKVRVKVLPITDY